MQAIYKASFKSKWWNFNVWPLLSYALILQFAIAFFIMEVPR